MKTLFPLVLSFALVTAADAGVLAKTAQGKPALKRIDVIEFGPGGVLFIGDGAGAQIFAVQTAEKPGAPKLPAKLPGINARLAEKIGAKPDGIEILDFEAALRDAAGHPLAREFRHTFLTTAEVHALLDLAAWTLEAPRAGTREPLRVTANVPLDAVLARRYLSVRAATGDHLPGSGTLARDARTWIFIPDDPWPATALRVAANPALEDLAGNTFERVFDTDLEAAPPATTPQTTRTFTPR